MAGTIDPPEDYTAGESLVFPFDITKPDGSAKDLTGATAEWLLLPSEDSDDADALLTDSDTGVSLSFDSPRTDGEITLTIARGETDGWGDNVYHHELRIDGDSQGRQIWDGNFPINK